MPDGVIVKGVGGLYYGRDAEGCVTECKVRGLFRNLHVTPAVGDRVSFRLENSSPAVITDIYTRKTLLTRPLVANASTGVIVCSLKQPEISYLTIDKLIISNKAAGIDTLLCLNKCDLYGPEEIDVFLDYYGSSGIPAVCVSAKSGQNIDALRHLIDGRISVFAGVSGSGKSSIIARLTGREDIEIGGLSAKTRRGRHTTRHSELMAIGGDTYLMDTPDFRVTNPRALFAKSCGASMMIFMRIRIAVTVTCMHLNEPGCGVKKAVNEKKINPKRYENYVHICQTLKEQQKIKNK
jgi:ribosome biogenesis GTPase